MQARRALIINPADNVATALEDLSAGEQVSAQLGREVVSLVAVEAIPFGFKIALTDIQAGEAVVKYGATIGRASRAIGRGELTHVHNVEGNRGRGDLGSGGGAR
jgi:altronate dehydratase small subunit